MKNFTLNLLLTTLLILLIPSNLLAKGHLTQYENPFSIVYGGAGTNIYGDYTSISSSVQCVNKSGKCNYSYNGALYDATTKYENSVSTSIIPLNSSTETLSLPADIDGKNILYAGLYWQGNITGSNANNYSTGIDGRDKISLQDAKGNIHTLTSDKLWYHDFWGDGTGSNGGYRSFYQGYKDVTTIIQDSYVKGNTNNYTVGNIKSTIGSDYGTYFWGDSTHAYNGIRIGFWGNWNLIVVYQHSNVGSLSPRPKPKNITLFQGFDALIPLGAGTQKSVTLPLSGFLTPSIAPVEAKLLFYGAGAEKVLAYDTFKIQDGKTANYINLSNTLNPADNAFNGSVSSFGVPINPSISYYPGLDSDEFDISFAMDTKQTSTSLSLAAKNIGGTGDQIFPGLIAFSTDIYEPKFCYDYAYKQQGKYFTEKNDGSKDPRLVGNVIVDADGDTNTSVDMTIFIRNLVDSDIAVTDMFINILDMNTSQVKYKRQTTSLAIIPNIIPIKVSDTNLDVADNYIKDIPIGTMSSNDYFYTYYSLNPQQSDLNTSMNVEVNYNLSIDGTTIPYTLALGSDIDMCSSTNFNYAPVKGMFNIVHNNYFPHANGNYYYNLPTQVASREGNFKAIVMDPDNLDAIKALPNKTMVAVELIDTSAFHDTFTSCKELESAITPRIWIEFDANASSTLFDKTTLLAAAAKANALETAGGEVSKLPNSYDFYKVANENTAFRISYNTDGENDFLLDYTESTSNPNMFKINNFSDAVRTIGTCSHDVFYFDKNGNFKKNVKNVSTACGNSGSEIPISQLEACLECIYGYNTELVCSRDNFSIRPEAFLIHLKDQNQTNSTNPATPPSLLTSNYSGVTGATPNVLNLAADYNYNIEVNTTNHLNNTPTPGYTKSFNSSNLNDKASYIWEPRGLTVAELSDKNLACNDDTNKSSDMRFVDGGVDTNTSVSQVGEYRLNILDTTWTTVDSNPSFMSHHANSFFYPGDGSIGLDCLVDDSSTQAVNSAINNGCNISSSHTGSSSSNLKYNDYEITFHPYKFNINTILTMGLTNRDINTSNDFSNFVYMANINVASDINMSVQVNSTIIPQGYGGSSLSNFVTECYAKPLDINISKSAPLNTDLDYRYILSDRNTTGTVSGFIPNVTNEDANITTSNTFFAKTMNGVLDSIMNLNFDRNQSVVANPEDINYSKITVYDPRTFISADLLANKTAESNISLNGSTGQNITHYFGRTAARKTRAVCDSFPCLSGANGEPNVFIYYEAYCYGTTNGNNCNRNLLPQLSGRYIQKVDSRWYVNLNHVENGDGNLTATSEAANFVTVPNITNANKYTKNSIHIYNGNEGLPYNANMQSTVPRWLRYDENDPFAITNKHIVIFQSATKWSGQHETNTTTQTQKVRRVNRRTMW